MAASEFEHAQEALFARYHLSVEHRFVEVPATNGRAHVMVCGDGPPVVLVIGGGAPGALWAPLMAELPGFTLYAVDRPGFGLTDPVAHSAGMLRRQAVEFLEQVLDGLELPNAAIVANSMGGLWSSWLSLDRPDRVTSMSQIGCAATMLGTSAPAPMRMLAVRGLGRLMMRLEPPSPRQTLRIMKRLGDPVHDTPEIRDVMVACQRRGPYASTWLALLHATLRARGARPAIALGAAELARIRQPVQLIWGRDDPFGAPDVGEKASTILPNAELHVIEGGHVPWISHASQIGGLVTPFLLAHAAPHSSKASVDLPGSTTASP